MLRVGPHCTILVHNPGMTLMFWLNFSFEGLGIVGSNNLLLAFCHNSKYIKCVCLCAWLRSLCLLRSLLLPFHLADPFGPQVVCHMLLFHVGLDGEIMQGMKKKGPCKLDVSCFVYSLSGGTQLCGQYQLSLVPELFHNPSIAANCTCS